MPCTSAQQTVSHLSDSKYGSEIITQATGLRSRLYDVRAIICMRILKIIYGVIGPASRSLQCILQQIWAALQPSFLSANGSSKSYEQMQKLIVGNLCWFCHQTSGFAWISDRTLQEEEENARRTGNRRLRLSAWTARNEWKLTHS